MANIVMLDNETIDKIAAGEVIERPASIVKELVENAIDATARVISVEIKDGGISLIRVTDNGEGIRRDQIRTAFLRHATSKIRTAEDLFNLSSLGFRGEALSSISAVSETEVITKVKNDLIGTRYLINGGIEVALEEVGAPNGTTFLIRNLFYNTPARKKFLKSETTESNQIYNLMEHLALSKPEVAFTFISNGKVKLQTSGNGDIRQVIYRIYGKDVLDETFYHHFEINNFEVNAYLGTPALSRGTRNFENLFINNRYVHSDLITGAIETAYQSFLMQHRFPFALLYITCNPNVIDVNIHPSKKEVRFNNQGELAEELVKSIQNGIKTHRLIQETKLEDEINRKKSELNSRKVAPEPFETSYRKKSEVEYFNEPEVFETKSDKISKVQALLSSAPVIFEEQILEQKQETLFTETEIQQQEKEQFQILGQIFDTYWILSFSDKVYFIDQHAAHEKVMYERLIKQLTKHSLISQNVNPPIVVTLTAREISTLNEYDAYFKEIGFMIENFGGNEYAIREIPMELFGKYPMELFKSLIDELSEHPLRDTPEVITNKIASMACKSAVKGNNSLSKLEMEELIRELMELENPFFCPHGRPTIFALTEKEIEKKFKRIV